jgi:hypothetical protein
MAPAAVDSFNTSEADTKMTTFIDELKLMIAGLIAT